MCDLLQADSASHANIVTTATLKNHNQLSIWRKNKAINAKKHSRSVHADLQLEKLT